MKKEISAGVKAVRQNELFKRQNMNTADRTKRQIPLQKSVFSLALLGIFLIQAMDTVAQLPPGFKSLPQPLASWSFSDTNNWTSDQGYAPIFFANIGWSNLGNGHSLVVDTNGASAFLNYYIFEPTNSASNLVLNA